MWKEIEDYDYSIREDGVVMRTSTQRVVRPSINPDTGYLYVGLWKDNKGKTASVHRLVALAFIPNPNNKPNVNHKDSDRTNPHKDNLEWATQSENILHGYEHGFMSQAHKRKLLPHMYDLIIQMLIDGGTQSYAAAYFGISEGRLSVNLKAHLLNHPDKELVAQALKQQKNIRNKHANTGKEVQVIQLDLLDNYIQKFPSYSDACRVTGVPSGNIVNVIKGRCKTAGGFKWKSV